MIKQSMARNKAMWLRRKGGATLAQLSVEYHVTPERVRRICLRFSDTGEWLTNTVKLQKGITTELSEVDARLFRDLIARNSLATMFKELGRITSNYGYTSDKWRAVSNMLRMVIARAHRSV